MRVIVIGQGPFGTKVLEALVQKGEEVVGVFCPPDKRGDGMRDLAEGSGIPVFRCSGSQAAGNGHRASGDRSTCLPPARLWRGRQADEPRLTD